MKKFYSAVLFLFLTLTVSAQKSTITGFVTDNATKEKLSGVIISVDGVNTGVTGIQGDYKLVVSQGEHTIKFTMLGYEAVEKKVNIKNKDLIELNIKMSGRQENLGVVVITGSQYEKDLTRENVSIDVLSKDQLKNNNSTDLGDAVNRTPGVQVQDGQVNIRGGSSYSYGVGSRTAVLVDNLSIASNDLGMNQWTFAPLENAEQVEVTKGSASVVYGSSALNGVINVRTAWPGATPETELTSFVSVVDKPDPAYLQWWTNDYHPGAAGLSVNHKQKFNNVDLVAGANLFNNHSYLTQASGFRARANFKTRVTSKKVDVKKANICIVCLNYYCVSIISA